MLIGIDASRALRPERTGTERYSQELIRHLLALPKAPEHDWRLYVDLPAGDPALQSLLPPSCIDADVSIIPDFVEFVHLARRRLWTHRSLARQVVQRPPDVLFIPAHVLPFVLPRRRLPASVVTVHDLGYRRFPEAHSPAQRLYLELSTRWSAWAASRLIAVSGATADDLAHCYGTPAAKIDVVYEAPSVPSSPSWLLTGERTTEALRRYRLQRPYALFLGTLQPRKNLERLIRAFAKVLPQKTFDHDLVLAGKAGWRHHSLHELSQALNLDDRIHFLGYVPEEERALLLQEARFFCFVSLFEGFGLPVLEAQLAGVPVMTSTNSSLPEVAGDAALLVDPTDVDAIAQAMLRLSQDEGLRQQLIAAGYENVKRFSWEKAARQTLAVLIKAAQGKI
jgi:glycosyltransferase involved in cell wall biosynthesis